MKKFLLSICGLISGVLYLSAQGTILSQSFSGGFGSWKAIDHNVSAGKWIYTHNSIATTDYGAVTFLSPTASNGFAAIVSDGRAVALNTDLISPVMDCSSATYVALQWDQMFADAQSNGNRGIGTVLVSTDSISWSQVYDSDNDYNWISSAGAVTDPELLQIDISQYAANQPKVWVKFNYQANDDYLWAVDDIKVLNTPANDVAVLTVNAPDYMGANNNYTVQTTIQNMGHSPLTSVTLTFSANNGTLPVTETFTGMSLNEFDTVPLMFSTFCDLRNVTTYNLKVVASNPNNTADINPANDTASKSIITLSHVPNKNVLLEEFSTIVCGYCPGGLVRVEQIMGSADSSYCIPVTLHAGFYTDSMTTNEASAIAAEFTDAAPTAAIDRQLLPGNAIVALDVQGMGTPDSSNPWDVQYNDWWGAVEARHPYQVPVGISAYNTFDSVTRVLTVTVHAKFFGDASIPNMRMNCYIVEDSVVGPNPDYEQHSYDYSTTPAIDNPWYHIGTSIGAGVWGISGYVQHHVDRALISTSGTWGKPGTIPTNTTDGSVYSETYTYTLPTKWREKFLTLVPFVYQYSASGTSGLNTVWNAMSMKLNSSDSIYAPAVVLDTAVAISETPSSTLAHVTLYPNPAADYVYISYNVSGNAKLSFEVYNLMGQLVSTVAEGDFSKGNYSTIINTSKYSNGLYLVAIKDDSKVIRSLKFEVTK